MKAARAEGEGHMPAMEKKTRVRPKESVQIQISPREDKARTEALPVDAVFPRFEC